MVMPLFAIQKTTLTAIESVVFDSEKKLQNLIEANLHPVFNCRLVATEFPTGSHHAGRIDTLALSEDDNPVIIEYKNKESSELINQSLFYLHWIHDHRGDFQITVNRALGKRAHHAEATGGSPRERLRPADDSQSAAAGPAPPDAPLPKHEAAQLRRQHWKWIAAPCGRAHNLPRSL